MGWAMMANFTVVGINTVLLTLLLVLYGRMLAQAFTRFTLGLLLFALALWSQCAVQLYFYVTMMPLYAGDMEAIILIQNALALLASAFLLTVTVAPVGRRAAEAEPDVA